MPRKGLSLTLMCIGRMSKLSEYFIYTVLLCLSIFILIVHEFMNVHCAPCFAREGLFCSSKGNYFSFDVSLQHSTFMRILTSAI